MNEKKIILNAIKCKNCNDVISSTHRHDFVWCTCKKVAVDGGRVYLRRVYPNGEPKDHYEELSKFE